MAQNGKMKALVKPFGKWGLILRDDIDVPTEQDVGPGDVLIEVLTASVCGTDLHIYKSDPTIQNRVANDQIIGHEFCGRVVYAGEQVTTLSVDDIVSSESHIVCGTCERCRNNEKHLCEEVTLVGIDRPGGLAEYVVLPAENAIPKSSSVSIEVAAMMDAYGNAVDTASTVPLIGKNVLVTGCGPQGLMTIAIALSAGAKRIIATEVADSRITFAEKILDLHANPRQHRFDKILKADDPDLIDLIYKHTDGEGIDVLLETAGVSSAIRDGFAVLKNGGSAVILGIPSGQIELDWAGLVFKGATVYFRHGRKLYQTWDDGRKLLEFGAVNLEALVYPKRFQLVDFEEAFNLLLNGEAAKVVFKLKEYA